MYNQKILLTVAPLYWPKMPPIGLGYLQAHLEKNGILADILDLNNFFYNRADSALKRKWLINCNAALENTILEIVKKNDPEIFIKAVERMLEYETIGFSCFKSNLKATLKLAALLKRQNKFIKIIFGGPEITRQFFKHGKKITPVLGGEVDFLVIGEGERPLENFLTNRVKGKIAVFEQAEGLAAFSFPRYRGVNFATYPKKDAAAIQFSRGCVRRCSFCAERLLYTGFRCRDVVDVIREIEFHKTQNNTHYFVFFDSMLNADLTKLEALCDRIIDRFGSVPWEA